jgi:hypothetical protein
MSTYDHNKVLADYASGKITPEMAVGHSLQHISQLYEAQAETSKANLSASTSALPRSKRPLTV